MDLWLRQSFIPSLGMQFTSPNPYVRRDRNFFGIRGEVSLTPDGRRKELYLTSSNPGLVAISRPPKLFRDLLGVF
jgi:hypothetical protein